MWDGPALRPELSNMPLGVEGLKFWVLRVLGVGVRVLTQKAIRLMILILHYP